MNWSQVGRTVEAIQSQSHVMNPVFEDGESSIGTPFASSLPKRLMGYSWRSNQATFPFPTTQEN